MELQMRVHPIVRIVVAVLAVIFLTFQVCGIAIIAFGEQKDTSSTNTDAIDFVETATKHIDKNNAHLYKQVEDSTTNTTVVADNNDNESSLYNTLKLESDCSHTEYFTDSEYPAAEKIWNIMKSYGWSNIVCAGIMGNLMAEVGGQTLDLNWQSYTGAELGICQWMNGRQSKLISIYGINPSCEEQVQYMYDELMGTNNVHRQVSEYQYQLIMNSSTVEEAALMFAKYFERCATYTYDVRQRNSVVAYNYFCK